MESRSNRFLPRNATWTRPNAREQATLDDKTHCSRVCRRRDQENRRHQ